MSLEKKGKKYRLGHLVLIIISSLGILFRSDGSGTRKPENPTRPEGFLLTRTRPEPEKNITNPTRPEPEILQTRPENPKKPEYIKNMYFYQNIHKVFTEKVRPKFFL